MFQISVPPVVEPVSLAEAKEWLRIHPDFAEDDNLIRMLIRSARVWAEKITGMALMEQTVVEVWDRYQEGGIFYLSVWPVISVTSLQYMDDNGDYQTWAASKYTLDAISRPSRIVNKNRIQQTGINYNNQLPNIWRATYKAGNTTTNAVDPNVKSAMLLQIAMMYEKREDMPIGQGSNNPYARSAYALLNLCRTNYI